MEIRATTDEINYWIDSKLPIQQTLPWLNDDEREFLMTGITPEEWNAMELDME